MLRVFSLLALFWASLWAEILDFETLKSKPKGLAKDYYINRLATETKLSKKEAKALSNEVFRNAGAVRKNLDKIIGAEPKISPCAAFEDKILEVNATCQNALSTMGFSIKLDAKTRQDLALNLKTTHPKKAKILETLNQKNPAFEFAKQGDADSFIALFHALKKEQRDGYFGLDLKQSFSDKLYHTKGFSRLLNSVVLERNLDQLRANFTKISPEITEKKEAFFFWG